MSDRVYGFLGLGNMGAPMAANIAAAGFDVVGYDAAGTKDRLPEGVRGATSVAEVVRGADTVLLSVPDGRVKTTLRLTFRASDRTLEQEEVNREVERLAIALREKLGVEI